MINKSEKIRQYLLGNLDHEQFEKFDLRLIENPELEREFQLAEESLIEDYLEGVLSEEETRNFDQNFAVSEARLDEIQLIKDLKEYAAANSPDTLDVITDESSVREGFLVRFVRLFKLKPILAFGLAGFLMVFVGLGWFVLRGGSQQLSGPELEYSVLNSGDLRANAKGATRIDLIPGKQRGDTAVLKVDSSDPKGSYFFVLAVSESKDADTRYRVSIEQGSKVLFRQERIRSFDSGVGKELRFLAPKSILVSGEMKIRVIAEGTEPEPQVFYFIAD